MYLLTYLICVLLKHISLYMTPASSMVGGNRKPVTLLKVFSLTAIEQDGKSFALHVTQSHRIGERLLGQPTQCKLRISCHIHRC